MGGFSVEPAELAGLAGALERVRVELTAGRLSAPPPAGAGLGDPALADALDGVLSNWSRERERLDALLAAVAGAAQAAAAAYAAADAAVGAACRGARP